MFQEEKIKVNDCVINYVKVGTGAHHAMFLPGALGTIWTEGKPQVEGFDREKFTLVAWDPPGYGKSRPPEKKFTTDFYEKDAESAYEFMKVDNAGYTWIILTISADIYYLTSICFIEFYCNWHLEF